MALILCSNSQVISKDLGLAKVIDEKINKVIASITELSETLISSKKRDLLQENLWSDLNKLILDPLRKYINEKKRIFFTLDSSLNALPLNKLKLTNSENYLFEEKEIVLLTKGRDLIEIYKHQSKRNNNKSLVIANPNFKEIKDRKKIAYYIKNISKSIFREIRFKKRIWDDLPFSNEEGFNIAKILNADLLIGEAATKTNLKKFISPKILHIASHSFYEDEVNEKDILLKSGIVLANSNDEKKPKENNNILTALEITKMDLRFTEMVVVSSCKSGIGKDVFGENILGIKSAITVSGAKSNILTLWEIDDAATSVFMKCFYERLKLGDSRAEALFKTQKDFKTKKVQSKNGRDWSDIFYWGAFQLSGDWRSINFD